MKNTLDEFVKEMQTDLIKFSEKYKEKSKNTPNDYPIELPEENSGLWLELFIMYLESGNV